MKRERKKKKQKSKDEQICVEKIYINSGIATAGKEQQEKQLTISKTKSKKLIKKKEKKSKTGENGNKS